MGLHDLDVQMSAKEICDRGEAWRKIHADRFKDFIAGTYVIIEVASGEYVSAETWHLANESFKQKFGPGKFGYSFDVDRPIFIGGGIWLK